MSANPDYAIADVWEDKSEDLKNEIINFWLASEAMPRDMALERVDQVFCTGRDSTGRIVGVGTVYPRFNKHLENSFYVYRTFVAPDHRRELLAVNLLKFTRDRLEKEFVSGKNTRCVGMMVVVTNDQLKKYRNQAVWPHTGFVYIGKNSRGDHVRVYYFKGARIS
ncbi:MAG: hypothetical protein ACLFPD_04290 [Desulfosudaceae bacterium]